MAEPTNTSIPPPPVTSLMPESIIPLNFPIATKLTESNFLTWKSHTAYCSWFQPQQIPGRTFTREEDTRCQQSTP
jgi:hypothetical protein